MESMEIDKKSDGSTGKRKEDSHHLRPVAVEQSGQGLPYAPEDWPNPGDVWTWKVGRRVATTGHFLDRYLYPPKRLCHRENGTRKKGFASKLSVERYIRDAFPDADINAFFSSFSWKIPAKPSPIYEIAEPIIPKPQSDGGGCKAENKMCSSLLIQAENTQVQAAAMPCDICCSEPHFCRDCCCILCCKSINSCYGGYSYIKCEAVVSHGYICGHVAHINCALRTYMAGTVGGSIGLDAEYYCRRCDARTDLIPHCFRLLKTCESVDSRDELEKILNVGMTILNGSQKTDAKRLLNHIEVAIIKLKCGTILEDIWKGEEDDSPILSGFSPGGNDKVTDHRDILDNKVRLPDTVSASSDYKAETLKLDYEIDQVLQELRKSQEYEYKLAEEQLYAQKKYLQNLYQQLDKERSDLARHASLSIADDLLSAVLNRVDQINQEVVKLKEMEEVANGFGRTSKHILKEHYGMEVEK